MDFKGRNFLFVGEFGRCVDRCVKPTQMVEMAGGRVKQGTTVSKDVDYLVIGENGSKSWKNGVCPQEEKAQEMNANGQRIEVVSEKALFDSLYEAGVSEESWLASFNERLSAAYDAMAERFAAVDWSYDKEARILTLNDFVLPSWLEAAEDAEILGYSFGETRPSEYREDSSLVGIKEHEASDLKKILPWAGCVDEVESVYAPNLLEVPPAFFAWHGALKRADLPSVRTVRPTAFYECKNLLECSIPKALFIGSGAFENCMKLRGSVSLREVEYIGEHAFKNCFELTGVVVSRPDRLRCDGKSIAGQGSALKYVGDGAFAYCSKLKSFGGKSDGSVVFGSEVFHGCGNLR